MRKFMLDTNALIALTDESVSFDDFNDVYITDWCQKEFIDFFQTSKEFASYTDQKKEKALNDRSTLLSKIPKNNRISADHDWSDQISEAFGVSKSNLRDQTGINDTLLVALSAHPKGKIYTFVFSGEERCKKDVRNNGCEVIDFSDFKKIKMGG